jgi:hypothetical protein
MNLLANAVRPRPPRHRADGFSLLEVMIALFIFFLAVFAILDSMSQGLRAARGLQVNLPDIGPLMADLMLTNKLEEGVVEGDFGDLYPDFTWTRDSYQVATNGLFQLDITIRGFSQNRPFESTTSLLLWRPDSQVSSSPFRR